MFEERDVTTHPQIRLELKPPSGRYGNLVGVELCWRIGSYREEKRGIGGSEGNERKSEREYV